MNKFSIILPVRNGGAYIKECVHSILSQTNQDFNLVILENGSTDGTKEWLESLGNDKIDIYPSDRSLTIEENWARIVNIPKNEFITLIGHDDLMDKHYLSHMKTLIDEHPNATLYQSHFRYINFQDKVIKSCRKMKPFYNGGEFLEAILTDQLDTMGTGYLMRAKDYDAVNGIPSFPNLLFADHTLWIRLASISYIAVAERECFSYRLNQSVSKTAGAAKYIDAFFSFLLFLKDLAVSDNKKKDIVKNFAPGFIQTHCQSLAHRLLRTPIPERDGKTVASFITKCKQWTDQLAPENQFEPLAVPPIRMAKQIDDNFLLRKLYLAFRKAYTKPIYS